MSASAILLLSCPDQPGIVAKVTNFISGNQGNILHLDQHVDQRANAFFMRVEWELNNFQIRRESLETKVQELTRPFEYFECSIHFTDVPPRVALFVSKANHCMYDLLVRYKSGELDIEIPLIVSNHETLREDAEKFGIPFHHFPITKGNKAEQEKAELELLAQEKVDTVVLARYMQIVSQDFVSRFPNRIINIHHSFLPAFIGAKPYHQAYERGVKIIGATSHYVTSDLDQGPIIEQDVASVSHRESIEDFIRQGRDLEKVVLARAVWSHSRRRILTHNNRTVVFR